MRLVRDLAAILAILIVVLSCNLFSGDEQASSGGGDGTETSAPGESGGSKSDTDDEGEQEDETPEPESDQLNRTTTVRFAKGKSSRSYSSAIKKGGSHTYRLSAAKGQDMDVEISSKQNNAELRVLDPSGKAVANEGSRAIFSANLPSTGTYKIIVTSDKGDDSFTVDFIVAGGEKAKPDPDPPAGRGLTKTVKFGKGRSSASYSDAVLLGTRNNYILGAQAGQLMSVSISSVENNAVFQIRGPNGYLRGAGPGTDKRSWSGQLPANGKYTVIVGSTRGNATYDVTFSIR